MKATVKELRRVMFDFDFDLMANKKTLKNSEGRRFLYELEDQDLEVEFYIGSSGTIVVEANLKLAS